MWRCVNRKAEKFIGHRKPDLSGMLKLFEIKRNVEARRLHTPKPPNSKKGGVSPPPNLYFFINNF